MQSIQASIPKLDTSQSDFFLQISRNFLQFVSRHLNYNNIRNLQESSFNLKDLIELKLNHNKLASLPLGVFKSLRKLIRL